MDSRHLEVAVAAARAGAAELMSRRDHMAVFDKGYKDVVTDADYASQKAIREILDLAFPRYAFVGEEDGLTQPPFAVRSGAPDAPPCWIVDPLDGTINYVHRFQSFAVSIGLYHAGRMRLGVVLDPVAGELFTALDGMPAHCNGQAIRASGCDEIQRSLLACSFPASVRCGDVELQRFISVLEHSQSIRRLGSCALNLCYVAAGRLDGYWATSVSPWDSAAGTVIARSAGATMTAYDGTDLDDWSPKFCVAGSVSLHRTIVDLLNKTF
jgi:myo-inositol-1(or 4)-monophosphatase